MANNVLAEYYASIVQPYAEFRARQLQKQSAAAAAPGAGREGQAPQFPVVSIRSKQDGSGGPVICFDTPKSSPSPAAAEEAKEKRDQEASAWDGGDGDSPLASLGQTVIVVAGSLYVVTKEVGRCRRLVVDPATGQEDKLVTEVEVEVQPDLSRKIAAAPGKAVQAAVLGFAGNFKKEYEAANDVRRALDPPRAYPSPRPDGARERPAFDRALVSALLDPSKRCPGSWSAAAAAVVPGVGRGRGRGQGRGGRGGHAGMPRQPIASALNPSQQAAVDCLSHNLESIQGPPGTGKSTTIVSIIERRVPENKRAYVTCTRNKAVDSVSEKLEADLPEQFVVFGNPSRMGEAAKRGTLSARVERHPWTVFLRERRNQITAAASRVQAAIARLEMPLHALLDRADRKISRKSSHQATRERWERHRRIVESVWRRMLERSRRFSLLLRVGRLLARLEAEASAAIAKKTTEVRQEILSTSRVFLSTIASTGAIFRELEAHAVAVEIKIHTAIVDEAACTPETSIPLLLRLGAKNLVLVGDHKQLPPFTAIEEPRPHEHGYKAFQSHARSLMERTVVCRRERPEGSPPCFMLREQYRMHPAIRALVSSLFYDGKLLDGAGVGAARPRPAAEALAWHAVEEGEQSTPKSTSYYNEGEVRRVVEVYREERARSKKHKIAIIALYKLQTKRLQAAMAEHTKTDKNAEVITVDAAQGSEADVVILSLVRCNAHRKVGFAAEPRRLCVALSRAKQTLHIVGSQRTFAKSRPWASVIAACKEAAALTSTKSKAGGGHGTASTGKAKQRKKSRAAKSQQQPAVAVPSAPIAAAASGAAHLNPAAGATAKATDAAAAAPAPSAGKAKQGPGKKSKRQAAQLPAAPAAAAVPPAAAAGAPPGGAASGTAPAAASGKLSKKQRKAMRAAGAGIPPPAVPSAAAGASAAQPSATLAPVVPAAVEPAGAAAGPSRTSAASSAAAGGQVARKQKKAKPPRAPAAPLAALAGGGGAGSSAPAPAVATLTTLMASLALQPPPAAAAPSVSTPPRGTKKKQPNSKPQPQRKLAWQEKSQLQTTST